MRWRVETAASNYYEILQVHPAAPLDLVTAAYWRLADRLQAERGSDSQAAAALHRLTKAYQTLADPNSRAAYDPSIGLPSQPSYPPPPRRQRSSRSRGLFGVNRSPAPTAGDSAVDYYELLRVDPRAEPRVIAVAYAVMRDYYLRLVLHAGASPELMDLFEEASDVIADPDRRQQYDAARARRARPPRPAQPPAAPVEPSRPRRRGRGTLAGAAGAVGTLALAATVGSVKLLCRAAPPTGRTLRSLSRFLWRETRIISPHAGRFVRSSWEVVAKISRDLAVKTGRVASRGGRAALSWSREVAGELGDLSGPGRSAPAKRHFGLEEEAILMSRLSPASAIAAGQAVAVRVEEPTAVLLVRGGPAAGKTFPLDGTPLTLGKHNGADIVLPWVASRQTRLWARDGRFMICNLADDQPVLVNGQPVVWAALEDGDLLIVGPHTLQFSLSTGESLP
jgi:curved DNA-binding protein CbpA